VPPSHWGPKGEEGYLGFQRDFIKIKRDEAGDEKVEHKAAVKEASAAWKVMDPQEKWERYGTKPQATKVKRDGPRGNFLVYRNAYNKE
jgi:hypothetical protein